MSNEEDKTEVEEQIEEDKTREPLMNVAEWKFCLSLPDEFKAIREDAKTKLVAHIKENNMTPLYKYLCKQHGWMEDEKLSEQMHQKNEEELKKLDELKEEAVKNAGDIEVRDAMHNKAKYLASIGEKEKALEQYEATFEKTVGSGGRIDHVFAIIRIGMLWADLDLIKTNIERASSMVEKGGDWERRNLLGVYEATYLIMIRQFKQAADKMLDAVATFTCYYLFDYEKFIFYTVVLAAVSLDRVTLKKKVINSPEILQVLHEIPNLKPFIESLFHCQYKTFFATLAVLVDDLKTDMYFAPHVGYYLREIRIVAYTQFLASYKSVTLDSMAKAFGVTTSFLDKELSRFVSANRLNCKVDAVKGIVETSQPDAKNQQYSQVIKLGDALLNRVQKLGRVITY